ncbi:nucleolar protein 16 [Thalassophryne amazonica]|uniref:nucleolar protein 16 n=1 Tax=Thalassophryne amazonica TaxID=390379 RepID=UPI0014713F03|nr:nucleolar protein 16 [Thalassophryne amazonica]
MGKLKKSSKRNTFDYSRDRKRLKKQFVKKYAPRIEHQQIRNAWNDKSSVAKNMQDMGLSFDPNRTIPVKKQAIIGAATHTTASENIVTKPYVLRQLEEEASRPVKDTKTLSSDLIAYVQHMIREHNDNYKAMARDEKNYYQDTPKQISRKIKEYKRCYPDQYAAFISSLAAK